MLYHGSTKKFDTLKTNVSYELEKWCYATDDYSYALIRCGAFDVNKALIREEHEIGKHTLCELYPGAFNDVFNRPGYMYILQENNFTKFRETEYVSDHDVTPMYRIEIKNVLARLLVDPSIILIKDEDSEEYWKNVKGGKQGYIQRKQESAKLIAEKKNSL